MRHRDRTRLRARLVAALVLTAGLAGAVPTAAQEPPAPVEQRLSELEREVAELRAALERARAQAPDADLAELERRIKLLAAELERLRLGEAAIEADESRFGLGPAASKVYRRERGVSIGGYGELVYQDPSARRDDGSPSGRTAELDLLRGVLYFGYKWNEKWLFNSELEIEHAADDEAGEVAFEFAYVDRLIRPQVNVRAGLLLIPMGFLNELHEPTVFHGVRRPEVERVILPTTWRENGIGVFGELGPLSYRSYVVNGFDAGGFSASGLRGGRQKGSKAKAEDLAWVTRLDWTSVPGLVIGGSAYLGDSGQGLRDAGGRALGVGTTILEGHAEWRGRGLELRALAARAELDDVAALNGALGLAGADSIGERLEGLYLEAGYDLGRHLPLGDGQRLVPFVRWESVDTQASVPAGFERDPARDVESVTFGLSWRPIEQLVVKADWLDVDDGAGTGSDQFNLGLGWVF